MTDTQKEIVLAMAEYDMIVSRVARAVHFHRNNVDYQIKRIKELYGLDARCFYDLVELVDMVNHDADKER